MTTTDGSSQPAPARAPSRDDGWPEVEVALLRASAADVERGAANAKRDAAAAVQALQRFRGRRAIRVADRLHRAARPLAVARRSAGGRDATGPVQPPRPQPDTPDPAEFRRRFLHALDQPGGPGVVIESAAEREPAAGRVASRGSDAAQPATTVQPATAARLAADAGWRIVPAADAAVRLIDRSDGWSVGRPRGPVLVALVDNAADWLDCAWLSEADLVVVPDAATAAALRERFAVAPQLAGSGEGLRAALRRWTEGYRIGIAIGIPSWEVAPTWGDLHFARDLQRQLERAGYATRIHILPEWADAAAARDDAAIHLFGLSVREPLPGQRTILWVISHPERVTPSLLARADRVYVASDRAVERFASLTAAPVTALHQATEPERFRPDRSGPAHDVLFVGNTRGVRRTMIEWLVPTKMDLAIYGRGWARQIGASPHIRGEHIPNDQVHRWYASAAVVLNDHWPDMREHGFLSNRLYDALAAGAFVVSDAVPGVEEEFDGGVVTADSGGKLRATIHAALGDPAWRRRIAERGRRAVLARHTFAVRAGSILHDLAGDLGDAPQRSRDVGDDGR